MEMDMCAMFNERDGKLLLARCERNNAATRATRGVRPVASTQPVAPVSAPAVSASPRTLRFTVPGKPVSLNRRFTPIIVKGKDGKERPAQTKAAEAQVFARGKFTFNKRFVETKFAAFIGEPKGDATQFSMEIKTAQAQFAVERILQVAATDLIIETVQLGQVTLLLTDILEIKLNPKTT